MTAQPRNSTRNGSRGSFARFPFGLFGFLTIVRFDSRVFAFFAFPGFDRSAFFGSFFGCGFRLFTFTHPDGFQRLAFGVFVI